MVCLWYNWALSTKKFNSFPRSNYIDYIRPVYLSFFGGSGNDDSDVNENGKKGNRYSSENNNSCSTLFVISTPSLVLHDYNVKKFHVFWRT